MKDQIYKLAKYLIFAGLPVTQVFAQPILSEDQAIRLALQKNAGLQAAHLETMAQKKQIKAAAELPKTNVAYMRGQYNSFAHADNNLSITQSIPAQVWSSQRAYNKSLAKASALSEQLEKSNIVFQIKQLFLSYNYLIKEQKLLLLQDSLYTRMVKATATRYTTGDATQLEKVSAETQWIEIKTKTDKNNSEQKVIRLALQAIINSDSIPFLLADTATINNYAVDSTTLDRNVHLRYAQQTTEISLKQKRLELAKAMPELTVGYFNQTLIGAINPANAEVATSSNRFTGFQIGIALPLWFVPHKAKVQAAELNYKASAQHFKNLQKQIETQRNQAIEKSRNINTTLSYYTQYALPQANMLLQQSVAMYQKGEIAYTEFVLNLQKAITIKEDYLLAYKESKQINLLIEYLSGYMLNQYEN
jgi:cobalt-zinc-cadmium resistance protein CzcA